MNKIHYTHDQMKTGLVELTRQMAKDNFRPDVIIGPGRGAYIPGVMLSHFYEVPFEGFTWQTRDGDETDPALLGQIIFKHIKGSPSQMLLIDDINDSGKTLTDIKERVDNVAMLWSGCPPIIKVATLFSKESSSFSGVDYTARTIFPNQDHCWVVFPYEEWWKST